MTHTADNTDRQETAMGEPQADIAAAVNRLAETWVPKLQELSRKINEERRQQP